jgi:hypothetical protein
MKTIKDKNGKVLKVGDKVHDKWGFDLIVRKYEDGYGWYGQLVCDPKDSCANIPYALNTEDIEFIE